MRRDILNSLNGPKTSLTKDEGTPLPKVEDKPKTDKKYLQEDIDLVSSLRINYLALKSN